MSKSALATVTAGVTIRNPDPPPDPCKTIALQLEVALADNQALRASNVALQAEVDQLKAASANDAILHSELLTDIKAIRGNSNSTKGDPWKRLHANVGRAEMAAGRLGFVFPPREISQVDK